MSTFDNPDYLTGYRGVLTLIDEQITMIERTLRTTGQTRTTRDDLRGRRDALTRAQTAVAKVLERAQQRQASVQATEGAQDARNDTKTELES